MRTTLCLRFIMKFNEMRSRYNVISSLCLGKRDFEYGSRRILEEFELGCARPLARTAAKLGTLPLQVSRFGQPYISNDSSDSKHRSSSPSLSPTHLTMLYFQQYRTPITKKRVCLRNKTVRYRTRQTTR